MKYKIFFNIFTFLLVLFISFNIYAYQDHALTDILLPNTVRAGEDFNATVIITSNTAPIPILLDLNVYAPTGELIYDLSQSVSSPDTHSITLTDINSDLNYSTQPYLIRGEISLGGGGKDDNPSNDYYSRYFTVIKSSDRVPVSDIPLFSGVIFGLLFLFVVFIIDNKKSKK